MKAIVNKYWYLESSFAKSKDGKKLGTYDGHITIVFRWGAFGIKGNNPLREEQIRQIAKDLKGDYHQINLDTTSDGTFAKSITILYIFQNESAEVFNRIKVLATKYF